MASSLVLIEKLQDFMDENFLKSAFAALGDYTIVGVRVIRKKESERSAGYGFLQFTDESSASAAVQRLQGETIPFSKPPIRFKLSLQVQREATSGEFAVWVSGLDQSIDDDVLQREFGSRFDSVRFSEVLRSSNGQSKGIGFVRFGEESDYEDALEQMDGYEGIGSSALKVFPAALESDDLTEPVSPDEFSESPVKVLRGDHTGATERNARAKPVGTKSSDWSKTTGWVGFDDPSEAHGYHGCATVTTPYVPFADENPADVAMIAPGAERLGSRSRVDADFYDGFTLIDYDIPIDVDNLNRTTIKNTKNFWNAFDDTRWYTPNIDIHLVDGREPETN